MEEVYNKHYITVEDGLITDGWSDGLYPGRAPGGNDVLLTDKGGYQFRLFPSGAVNPSLYTDDGIPRWAYEDGAVRLRTEAEIETDRAALPMPEPTANELLSALLGVMS